MISIETQIAGLKQLENHAPIVYKMEMNRMLTEFKLLDAHRGGLMKPKLTKQIERLRTLLTSA